LKEFKNNYGVEKYSKNNHKIQKDLRLSKTLKEIKVINNARSSKEIKLTKNNVHTNPLNMNRDNSFDYSFSKKKPNFLEKSKNLKTENKINLSKKGIKLLYIKNKKISKKGKKKYSNVIPCVNKKGILYLIDQVNKNRTIKAKEVVIKLTSDALEIFQTFNENTSIKTVNLNEILRITQSYSNTFCFDLLLTNKPFVKTTLCAKSKKGMNEWIHAILAFKYCRNNVALRKRNNKTVLKFGNANPSSSNGKRYGNKLENLFYNINNNGNNSPKIANENCIKKHISNIVHSIKMSHLAHSQLKRRFDGKINRARKNSDKMIRKQEKIKKLLQTQAIKQTKKENHLLILEHKHKELKLLKEVEDKITKLKVPF